MEAYSNDGDPFGHGQAKAAEGTVLAGSVRQQANGGEESDPVEEECNHERAQEYAIVANVLREILQLCVGRLIEESQLKYKEIANKEAIQICNRKRTLAHIDGFHGGSELSGIAAGRIEVARWQIVCVRF
jgi:hypothetical protein